MEIPRNPDFCPLSHLYTSLALEPLTSDFFISGNVAPVVIAALIDPVWVRNVGGLTKVFRAEGNNLFVRPRFLPTELVAREAQNDETLVFVLLVEGLQAFVLGREATGSDGSERRLSS